MNIVSTAFFRHEASGYESENAGVARGIFFVNYLRCVVRAHWLVWGPEWQLRIHHDDRIKAFPYFKALKAMDGRGLIKLVDCGKAETLCGSMLWRMKPLWENETDVLVCRDLDSLPMPRDFRMVHEFAMSGAIAHAVLDSESHSGPLMGGMCAFLAPSVRVATPFVQSYEQLLQRVADVNLNRHGADQVVLNREFWPAVKERALIHQKRNDIAYPEAQETRRVAPKLHPLDNIVHMGAAFDVEKALDIMKGLGVPQLDLIEASERETA